MRIWVYTIAYNESHFVKSFLRAYKDAEKIIVYDNMSTDDTVARLKEDPRVEIRPYDSGNQIRDDLYLQIKNNCWKEARGIADWVIICDFDEILTRALPGTFDLNLSAVPDYFSIIKPYGYHIVSENLPLDIPEGPLTNDLRGIYDTNSEKMCCFRPDKLAEINFSPGCHHADPVPFKPDGAFIFHHPQFKLLHFKYINILIYFSRLCQYSYRMSEFNKAHGYGVHYTWSFEQHKNTYMQALSNSQPLLEIKNNHG